MDGNGKAPLPFRLYSLRTLSGWMVGARSNSCWPGLDPSNSGARVNARSGQRASDSGNHNSTFRAHSKRIPASPTKGSAASAAAILQ